MPESGENGVREDGFKSKLRSILVLELLNPWVSRRFSQWRRQLYIIPSLPLCLPLWPQMSPCHLQHSSSSGLSWPNRLHSTYQLYRLRIKLQHMNLGEPYHSALGNVQTLLRQLHAVIMGRVLGENMIEFEGSYSSLSYCLHLESPRRLVSHTSGCLMKNFPQRTNLPYTWAAASWGLGPGETRVTGNKACIFLFLFPGLVGSALSALTDRTLWQCELK